MPLIDVDTAAHELRIALQAGEDVDLARKLAAAEEQVALFLGRNVYADQTALDAAAAAAPDALTAATAAYQAAMDAAGTVADETQRLLNQDDATDVYREAQQAYRMARRGMVVNDSVKTAILLIAGSLWEHRGDEDAVEGVPPTARTFLWPFRCGLGV